MTTPTAPLTTAAEMAREFFRIDPDAALTPTVERCVADLAAFLTTYAAQVRREAPHHHDRLLPCPRCKHVALWRVTTNEGDVLLVDALPPGSPSSQTDTGGNNG